MLILDKSLVVNSTELGLLIRLLLSLLITEYIINPIFLNFRMAGVRFNKILACIFRILTFILFSSNFKLTLVFGLFYIVIIPLSIDLINRKIFYSRLNQSVIRWSLYFILLFLLWNCNFGFNPIRVLFINSHLSNQFGIILTAYLFILFPVGLIIDFLLVRYLNPNLFPKDKLIGNIQSAMIIGQAERVIILTLVLLQQYEAIGFLITGKSILRFTQDESRNQSEFVLMGTLLSYTFALLTGVLINGILRC